MLTKICDWIGPRPAIRPASSPVSPRCHPPLIGVGDGCEKTAEIWPICHIHKDRHADGRVTWFDDQGLRNRPANQVPIHSRLIKVPWTYFANQLIMETPSVLTWSPSNS